MSTPSNAVSGISARIASNGARGHFRRSQHVLGGAARIVGAPFDLYRPAGRRRSFSIRLLGRLNAQSDAPALNRR